MKIAGPGLPFLKRRALASVSSLLYRARRYGNFGVGRAVV